MVLSLCRGTFLNQTIEQLPLTDINVSSANETLCDVMQKLKMRGTGKLTSLIRSFAISIRVDAST